MTNSALGEAAANRKHPDGHASVTREVADLVRHCSRIDGRHGFRVIAKGSSGHIFFDRGRVIHAEFGEDCGLRAVVEMLRAGPVQLERASNWPSQPSLHLGPELLLSLTAGDASRVVRKVDLPVGPPPLPDPQKVNEAESVSPDYRDPARAAGAKRAISGVMPRVVDAAANPMAVATPPSSAASPVDGSPASVVASRRSAALAASRLAASVAVSERSLARATGQPSPLPPPVKAQAVKAQAAVDPRADAPAALEQRERTELPIVRAQKARSRSIVVARTSNANVSGPGTATNARVPTLPGVSAQQVIKPVTKKVPAERNDLPGPIPPGSTARSRPTSKAPARAPGVGQPTTMVRIAARGDLLAARGRNAEQLAEAAAFIHGLANLIAADFGRHGRANVHLSGGGVSLLVARSEVNDIAGALGSTERLTSLLGKVGFK